MGGQRRALLYLFIIIFFFFFFSFAKAENILDIPFITQFPPGTSWNDTLNCGPTSYLMVDSFFTGRSLNMQIIKDVDDWLLENYNMPVNNYNGNNTYLSDIKNISMEFGDFHDEDVVLTYSFDSVKDALNDGLPVVVLVYTNMLKYGLSFDKGHFMVLTGISGDTVYTNDPGKTNGKNKTYPLSQFLYAWGLQNNAALIFYPPGHSEIKSEKIDFGLWQDTLYFGKNIFDWKELQNQLKNSVVKAENEEVKADEETKETINYNASISNKSQTLNVEPGQIINLTIEAKNTGNIAWQRNLISLNVVGGKEINQKFYTPSWKTNLRPTLVDSDVNVGETGNFSFQLQVPEEKGNYNFRAMIVKQNGTDFAQIGSDIFSLQLNVTEKEIEEEKLATVEETEKENIFDKVKETVDNFVNKVNDVVKDVVENLKQIPNYFGGGSSSGSSDTNVGEQEENTQTDEDVPANLFFTVDNNSNTTWVNTVTTTISGEKSTELTSLKINNEESDFINSSTTWSAEVALQEGVNIFSLEFLDSDLANSVTGTVNLYLDTIAPETPSLITILNTDNFPQIEISWQSTDAGSGLDYYVLEYKNATSTL